VFFDALFENGSFFPTSMVVLEDQKKLGMVFQILLRQNDFGWFPMVPLRRFILVISAPTAMFSTTVIHTPGSLMMSTRMFSLSSLETSVITLFDVD
jgi:hypothetical protein